MNYAGCFFICDLKAYSMYKQTELFIFFIFVKLSISI